MKRNARLGLPAHTGRHTGRLRGWPVERDRMETMRRGPFRGWCGIRKARLVTVGDHARLRRARRDLERRAGYR